VKIVVGYDGSDHARRALERAADLASPGDEVLVVGSVEPKLEPISTDGAHQDPSESEHRRQNLEEANAFLAERGIEAEAVEAYGDPGSAIVDAANDADLVVVGSRGRNTLERLLLGSVSSKVVHRAKSDVLVVR
jgi:nucleotide-binding universal stress UspA family protein